MPGRDTFGAQARVWQVGSLVQAVGDTLAARFGVCVVRGEIASFMRAPSGHVYFTLKDGQGTASLRCAMFRRAAAALDFSPREGMDVEVRGSLSVYEARGELQMVVEGMRQAGAGALYEQFLRLKAALTAEGLFDPARKRPIVSYPRRIAVVTSPAAAAWRDVMTTLARRAPHVEVVLVPTLVQGAEAPAQIVAALHEVQRAHRAGLHVDTVLVCRGGGSLEDLWAFNDERVVRAMAACAIPVIAGVGHETDVTLADLAADLRAPTPTAAAELVARDRLESEDELMGVERLLAHRLRHRLDSLSQRLDHAALRLSRPAAALRRQDQVLGALAHRLQGSIRLAVGRAQTGLSPMTERLQRALQHQCVVRQQRLSAVEGRLRALDPQRVLERGFAWLDDGAGQPLVSVQQVQAGQGVQAVLADGRIDLLVQDVAPKLQSGPRARPRRG